MGSEKCCLLRLEEACGLYCLAYDLINPAVAANCFSSLVVGDEKKLHRPFRKGEGRCGLVGLFVGGNKPHVPLRDLDKV